MAKGYWIAHVDVDDMETYRKYIAANAAPYTEYGGRFPVCGGDQDVREGTSRQRRVVSEFDSFEAAVTCYEGTAYSQAKAIRDVVSVADMIIARGYDG
jgi:uncharacterized protein (DUF1330 family)